MVQRCSAFPMVSPPPGGPVVVVAVVVLVVVVTLLVDLEATRLGQLEAKMKMMSGRSKLCSHCRLAGPRLAPYKPPGPSNIAMLRLPQPSKTLPEGSS